MRNEKIIAERAGYQRRIPLLLLLLTFAFTFTLAFGAASAAADVKMAWDITPKQFVEQCGKVCETARKKGYIYGDSRSMPPTADKRISCDRLIAKALWDLGFTDQQTGGITCGSMIDYLDEHGFVKSNKLSDIKYGSIVLIKHKTVNYWSHAFVTLNFNTSTMIFDEYDCGANSLIQSVQPIHRTWGANWRTSPVTVFNIPTGGSGSSTGSPAASETATPAPAKPAAPAYSIDLSERVGEMVTGIEFRLKASVSPSLPSDKKVVWSSTDPSIAKVSHAGNVRTITPGTVGIKAKVQGTSVEAVCTLTVLSEPVTKLTLNKKSASVSVGNSSALNAQISPSSATYHKVSWKSGNKKIATVSPSGVVTGKRAGTVTITAKAGDSAGGVKKASCTVTVKEHPVQSVKLNKKKLTLKVGKKRKLLATIRPANASSRELTWKSSNPKVAKVDRFGTVTAVSKGKAVITAVSRSGNKKASCTVNVKS